MSTVSESASCRLYLITPPQIELATFPDQLKQAFDGGDVACVQLRLKNASDDEILKAAEKIMPICREHEAAFIMNDRPDLAVKSGADGVHLGQEDFSPSPLSRERVGVRVSPSPDFSKACDRKPKKNLPLPQGGEGKKKTLAEIRKMLGAETIIGVSCHDSKHLAMEAGEQGADYVAFGAFYPTKSKSPEALAKYGTPAPGILTWWQENTVLPCVAIGGMTPANCVPLVRAGADFIAVITYVWNHAQGPGKAVEEFNSILRTAKP